jgi:hypothetical protein
MLIMGVQLAFLVEHDWIDRVNAVSTLVIAAFTVAMFFVVRYQLQASKDIERAWVMPWLARDPFNSLFVSENTIKEGTKITSVTTAALFQLTLTNDGNGPVWVKQLQARLVLLDSVEKLSKKPELTDKDDQHWYPPPFVDKASVRFQLTAEGSQVAKEVLVAYGKIVYLDKFREERFSTFGCLINSTGSQVERLKTHPEYNRNT